MTPSNKVVDLRKRPMRSVRPATGRLSLQQKSRLPLRARRRRARIYLALAALVLIALIAWAISWASYLPQFNIGAVSVSGTEAVSATDIESFIQKKLSPRAYAYLSPDNIFIFNSTALSKEIAAAFPRVKTAAVNRPSLFSTALAVAITERQPFALWCASAVSDCYQMDETGFLFALASQDATSTPTAATPYVFYGGVAASSSPIGASFSPAHLPGIIAFLRALTVAGFTPQGATVENDQDFSVPLQQGFFIKVSFGEDTETLVNNLQLILASDALSGKENALEYVDLRFGDKVYYKLTGQDQANASSSSIR